jgi:protoheme IX farnesyltransferase
MQSTKTTYQGGLREAVMVRVRAYSALVKMRLTLLVVFSAIFGYMMAPEVTGFELGTVLWLSLGGFLVTGASNTLNQVIETEHDRLMSRTMNRPLVQGMISPLEAVILAIVMGVGGITVLGLMFEGLVPALLGIIALMSYAFVYTPMKRISPIGVLIGAFPGAMPPLIGYAAATGSLPVEAWVLFLLQFLWQFPHFWAIGWVLDDDYRKAGFKMLPGNSGRSVYTASMTLLYTSLLIPASLVPYMLGMIGPITLVVLLVAAVGFTMQSYSLLRVRTVKAASRLMFGSFIYLPVMQISMLVDKF